MSAKTRKQTIQHGHKNAQSAGKNRRGLGRRTDSDQSNFKKERKPRSKPRGKPRSLEGTIEQTPCSQLCLQYFQITEKGLILVLATKTVTQEYRSQAHKSSI